MIQSKHCSNCYLIILTFSSHNRDFLPHEFEFLSHNNTLACLLLLLTSILSFRLIFSLHCEEPAPQNYDNRRLSTKQTLGVFLKCDQAAVKEDRGVGRTCALVAESRGASAEL